MHPQVRQVERTCTYRRDSGRGEAMVPVVAVMARTAGRVDRDGLGGGELSDKVHIVTGCICRLCCALSVDRLDISLSQGGYRYLRVKYSVQLYTSGMSRREEMDGAAVSYIQGNAATDTDACALPF